MFSEFFYLFVFGVLRVCVWVWVLWEGEDWRDGNGNGNDIVVIIF